MRLYRVVFVFLVILFKFVEFSKPYKYKAGFDDEDIFSDCDNQPDDVLNVHGLYNLSELITEYKLDGEQVMVSGNSTTVWNIHPDDRIQVVFKCLFPTT